MLWIEFMFEDHETFISPEDPNQIIWRFIDFAKFVDLISSNELFFLRLDRFDDQFEGSHTLPTVENRTAYFKHMVEIGEMTTEGAEKTKKILTKHYEEQRKHYAINCWHMNSSESAAMWSLYSKVGAGIAIRSTYLRLKESFKLTPLSIHIGKVSYVDYSRDATGWGVGFIPVLLKGKSFEHEHELRAVIWSWEGGNKDLCDPIDDGVRVRIDIDILIESVLLAPFTPQWIRSLVINVMDKYQLIKPIRNSILEGLPVY